ncbi:MAG: 16S rRNA (uracil(1498)-N(3))-methyltransferase [Limnochordia bacterium]|nr:16S rRNA (uracil(1498)-N(3))-methyltransferase [Limnochordia bacterium]MDD4517154.1 16S rRNA (uracil(1498)-N(3))-methyltransferase [Limnochordia bacterium]
MARHRFISSNMDEQEGYGYIDEPTEVHHLTKVLRLRVGDEIEVFDGVKRQYLARIQVVSDMVQFKILERLPNREAPLPLTLVQAIGKGDKLDFVMREGTQLGVCDFVPCWTKYSVVRLDQKRAEGKVTRWQRICQEAVKQCGRAKVPKVHSVMSFAEALTFTQGDLGCDLVVMPHYPVSCGLWDVLSDAKPKSVALVIGPEGGFSEDEAALAKDMGVHLVGLGPRILRTETAAVAALAAIGYALGDLGDKGEC